MAEDEQTRKVMSIQAGDDMKSSPNVDRRRVFGNNYFLYDEKWGGEVSQVLFVFIFFSLSCITGKHIFFRLNTTTTIVAKDSC